MANLKSTTISDTGFLQLPSGTTAERPQSPSAGEIRFNTDTKVTEWYDDQLNAWFPTGVVPPVATGGDTVEDVDIDGVSYRIHSFTTVGESTFTVTRGGSVEYLIVAGGGGGGPKRDFDSDAYGGGGGAGGVLQGSITVNVRTHNVTVGAGGTSGENGKNSYALGLTTIGGGAGGYRSSIDGNPSAQPGGSGGGGAGRSASRSGAAGTPGQGNIGGNGRGGGSDAGGGGGGAGSPGQDSPATEIGGDGGNGINSNINGSLVFYAGGGGGHMGIGSVSSGGLGGGGKGRYQNGESAQPNTGGGGGGERQNVGKGGDGGSGIVIIRYRIS